MVDVDILRVSGGVDVECDEYVRRWDNADNEIDDQSPCSPGISKFNVNGLLDITTTAHPDNGTRVQQSEASTVQRDNTTTGQRDNGTTRKHNNEPTRLRNNANAVHCGKEKTEQREKNTTAKREQATMSTEPHTKWTNKLTGTQKQSTNTQ